MTRLLMAADAVGGVWQYATELAVALAPFGIETILAVVGPTDALPDSDDQRFRIIRTGLPLDWLAEDEEAVIAAGHAVAKLARQVGADLVHLNSPALAAQAEFDMPVAAVAHGCIGTWWQAARGTAPDADFAWSVALTSAGLAAADAVVAPSAAFAETVARVHALPALPLVVHNGRTPLALPDAAPADTVFTAGRLWDEVKNIPLLDRVAARVPVPFRAAGPLAGPHGEGIAVHHLDTPGPLSEAELAAILATRPIYVSAARFEPFGLSVLEAAAAGCPLVLSNIDTFRELWTGAALLVPVDDEVAYVAAIERTRTDPTLRAHLGEAARLRAARYTPEAMAGAMAAIYAGLTATDRRAAA
ncbi:glycosyltransferase family 4 protein [Sphingomonas sp. KR1UV-12]|uniref:Glycosyltransferase family 4 protein n=1 Tax=Sphingomonas aurea TaxID=3063994 RepID=A0ABT9EHR2_9SPHN|nr:glycosyltransferase family 4 protein [Sphingomonas sp. KR1UV-12]MDP1026464.1 glycosyltransferase family 4 protein [Sphingomonas sp. KR1UV-12]